LRHADARRWPLDLFAEIMKRNIELVKQAGADTLIAPAGVRLDVAPVLPRVGKELGIDYPIRARHYSEILAEQIKAGSSSSPARETVTVTWHDSCHIGRASGITSRARLIRAIPT